MSNEDGGLWKNCSEERSEQKTERKTDQCQFKKYGNLRGGKDQRS